jgi:hypothetical protein
MPTDPCRQLPSPTLLAAVRQFNAGDYFVCHETLEALWLDEPLPFRDLYKGILQIGVGLLHLQRGNEKGARLLLGRGRELIAPFLPACLGLDLTALSAETAQVLVLLDDSDQPRPLQLGEAQPRLRLVEPD